MCGRFPCRWRRLLRPFLHSRRAAVFRSCASATPPCSATASQVRIRYIAQMLPYPPFAIIICQYTMLQPMHHPNEHIWLKIDVPWNRDDNRQPKKAAFQKNCQWPETQRQTKEYTWLLFRLKRLRESMQHFLNLSKSRAGNGPARRAQICILQLEAGYSIKSDEPCCAQARSFRGCRRCATSICCTAVRSWMPAWPRWPRSSRSSPACSSSRPRSPTPA